MVQNGDFNKNLMAYHLFYSEKWVGWTKNNLERRHLKYAEVLFIPKAADLVIQCQGHLEGHPSW